MRIEPTVRMENLPDGFEPWHVTWWSKPYSVGAIDTPALTYIDSAIATADDNTGG